MFFGDILSPDTGLQYIKVKYLTVFVRQYFSIYYNAIRQFVLQDTVLGKFVSNKVFTTAPYIQLIISFYQLSADAIPFPFGLPIGRIAEFLQRIFQRIGQVERVGF